MGARACFRQSFWFMLAPNAYDHYSLRMQHHEPLRCFGLARAGLAAHNDHLVLPVLPHGAVRSLGDGEDVRRRPAALVPAEPLRHTDRVPSTTPQVLLMGSGGRITE